jgi:AhpD family alkylhydroperoxidase
MQARIKNPAMIIPEAMQAIQALSGSFHNKGVPEETLALVHLRASQINGCSSCVQAGAAGARKAGEGEDRLATVAAWRDAPYFTAARHYDEEGLAALLLSIATTNVFNRLNAPTRQIAGAWGK